MLEAIANISIWKLLVIGILGFLTIVGSFAMFVPIAGALLGSRKHHKKYKYDYKYDYDARKDESSRASTGHTLGIMAICIGVGIVAAVWWKGPELSNLVLTVTILISGGFGLVIGSQKGLGSEIKRQKILDHRHQREMERERERRMEEQEPGWRQKEADVEASEPEWDRAAAEAEEQEWDEKAADVEVESEERAPNDGAPEEADEAAADIEAETNDEDMDEDDGEADRR
jgi:hypothetical protein